jgi:hypothetical protein
MSGQQPGGAAATTARVCSSHNRGVQHGVHQQVAGQQPPPCTQDESKLLGEVVPQAPVVLRNMWCVDDCCDKSPMHDGEDSGQSSTKAANKSSEQAALSNNTSDQDIVHAPCAAWQCD